MINGSNNNGCERFICLSLSTASDFEIFNIGSQLVRLSVVENCWTNTQNKMLVLVPEV